MRLRTRVLCVSILAASAAIQPVSAWAGFEWVAPKEEAAQGQTLPTPQLGLPRIAPQPLNGSGSGLDPLPPLSVDQENGTRATVYSPAPSRMIPAPAVSAEPAPRLKTLNMGSAPTVREYGAGRTASSSAMGAGDHPQQLRMSDKLVMPSDEEAGLAVPPAAVPAAEGRIAINPAPLQAPADSPTQPSFSAIPQQPSMVRSAPADVPAGPVLQGFGSDIPLVMALQQIVPPDYTYSFAGGVNPGESVSWEGGKNWPQVLNEMLGGKGLSASINGRSIQIQAASSFSPRAEAAPSAASVNVAEAMAATMPAAGDSAIPALVQPIDKVAAVPPVYPAGGVIPQEASVSQPMPSQKVLGRISDAGGLQVQDVRETVQVQGSPEAARAARQAVTDHALGLADGQPEGDSGAAVPVSGTLPSVKTASYSVTKITREVVNPKAETVVADAEKSLRRTNIMDPGEAPSQQPEVQALNLHDAKKQASISTKADVLKTAPAMVIASADPLPVKQEAAPAAAAVSSALGAEEQRKKLEDMARQQGVVLDAKSYSQEVLGKIFNNGIAPAAGEAAPDVPPAVSMAAPVSLIPAKEEIPPVSLKSTVSAATPDTVSSATSAGQQADTQFWEASRGADLQTTLKAWSQQSGVTLVWKAARPYTVGSNIMVHGGFNDAIKTLFADGTKSGSFPVIRLNDGGSAQGTLVVEDRS